MFKRRSKKGKPHLGNGLQKDGSVDASSLASSAAPGLPKSCLKWGDSRKRGARTVTFHQVHIREFERIIGDNPSCSSGAPISIGWNYSIDKSLSMDHFERTKLERQSRTTRDLVLTRQDREELLIEWGASFNEIIESIRSNIKAKHQRRRTVNAIGTYDRWEEVMENASRKIKRTLTLKKPKKISRKALQGAVQIRSEAHPIDALAINQSVLPPSKPSRVESDGTRSLDSRKTTVSKLTQDSSPPINSDVGPMHQNDQSRSHSDSLDSESNGSEDQSHQEQPVLNIRMGTAPVVPNRNSSLSRPQTVVHTTRNGNEEDESSVTDYFASEHGHDPVSLLEHNVALPLHHFGGDDAEFQRRLEPPNTQYLDQGRGQIVAAEKLALPHNETSHSAAMSINHSPMPFVSSDNMSVNTAISGFTTTDFNSSGISTISRDAHYDHPSKEELFWELAPGQQDAPQIQRIVTPIIICEDASYNKHNRGTHYSTLPHQPLPPPMDAMKYNVVDGHYCENGFSMAPPPNSSNLISKWN